MFNEVFPDPTAIFRFKIELQRLPIVQNVQDVDSWGLDGSHQLPPIDLFSEPFNRYLAKIGWNPQGLYLQIELSLSNLSRPLHKPYYLQTNWMVNSRFNPSILRGNEFCSSFIFLRNLHWKNASFESDQPIDERLLANFRDAPQNTSTREFAENNPLFGSMRSSDKGITLWLHASTQAMHGYRPEEFPDIGLYFDIVARDLDSQGSSLAWNMVHSGMAAPRANPSLWPHCRLV